MRVRARRAVIGSTLAAALAAAALAGMAAGAKAPAVRSLTASGTNLAFSKAALKAPKGPVKLVLTNTSGTFRHNIAVRRNGVVLKKGMVVGKGGVSRITVTLAPGRYTYLCTVGKHAKNGMTGTLTVTR
jgi:plastocyanin